MRGIDYSSQTILSIGMNTFLGLEKLGINPHETNRFYQYIKSFQRLVDSNGEGINNSQQRMYLIEGFRDIVELDYIYRNGILSLASDHEIDILFGGNRSPDEDKYNNSRDIQYQMYLAARIKESGYSISWEEPDLKLFFDDSDILLAVKRVSSINKVYTRIKEAEKQILKCQGEGIIALSLDKTSESSPSTIQNPDDLYNVAHSRLLNILRNDFEARYFIRDSNIKAIIVTLGLSVYLSHITSFGYGFALQVLPLAEEQTFEYTKYSVLGTSLLT